MPDPSRSSQDEPNNLAAYAGRWIAKLWGRVVGHGGTPSQALQAAKSTRHKESPQVSYVPTKNSLIFPAILDEIRAAIPNNSQVYLVGGAVRDAVLDITAHDLDFTLPKNSLKIARRVANKLQGAYYRMGDEHETGRVVITRESNKRFILDFSDLRGVDIEADLRARDFTINAMAVALENPQELLDPLNGINDLYNKHLRTCAPNSFTDDPVRILRAIRMAASFRLHMLPETRSALRETVPILGQTSPERLRDELFRVLDTKDPATSIRALEIMGVIEQLLPELVNLKGLQQSPPHVSDVWDHTLHTLQRLAGILSLLDENYKHNDEEGGDLISGLVSLRLGRFRGQISRHFEKQLNIERGLQPLLMFAALYHDSGKPETQSRERERIRFLGHEEVGKSLVSNQAEALRLSNAEIERLQNIVGGHMRPRHLANDPKDPSRRAVYRFFRDTGEAGVDICLLSLADVLATYNNTLPQEVLERHLDITRILLETYFEKHAEQVDPPTLVDGTDLIREFKLKPGPKIGEMLEAIREAQAAGEVKTKGDALKLAEGILED